MKLFGYDEEVLLRIIEREDGFSEGEVIEELYEELEKFDNEEVYECDGTLYNSEYDYSLNVLNETINSIIEKGFLIYAETTSSSPDETYYTINGKQHRIKLSQDGINYAEVKQSMGNVINNHGTISNSQFQNTLINSTQNQINNEAINYEEVLAIIDKIKGYYSNIDSEFKESALEFKQKIDEVQDLAVTKGDPKIIRAALGVIRDLSIGVSSSLIAPGITALISTLL